MIMKFKKEVKRDLIYGEKLCLAIMHELLNKRHEMSLLPHNNLYNNEIMALNDVLESAIEEQMEAYNAFKSVDNRYRKQIIELQKEALSAVCNEIIPSANQLINIVRE